MTLELLQSNAKRVSRWSAIALGASIPVSTALDNVLVGVTLLAWALSGQARELVRLAVTNKVLRCALLLFALLAVGTLYGESTQREALATLGKYLDLLYIPVFAMVLWERETRIKALHALAISLAVTVLLSYLTHFGLRPALPFLTGDATDPTVFKLRTAHNFLLAFGAFLFVWLGFSTASQRLRLVWFSLALLAAINVLFMVQGATGYLVLGVLGLLFIGGRFGWRGLAVATVALAVSVVALVNVPSKFQSRVTAIQQEIKQWRAEDAASTSAGQRLEFYRNTLDIIAEHPLAGVGTGGFAQAYAKQVTGTGKVQTHNPHNEFLHIAAQIGVLGLLVLIALFWTQWRAAQSLSTPMERSLARGLVLTMVIGCLVNSLLLDHTEGLFYAWLTGLLYGGLKYGQSDKPGDQKKRAHACEPS